jgi:tetratricopeptide (TPR) repeat protein
MKMKQPIVMMAAALTLSVSVKAQTLEEGIKMYNYERYETAKKVLTPLAGTNPLANYYLGLSELQLGNKDAAKALFQRNTDNYANMGGLVRIAFVEGRPAEGNQLATALAGKAKRKEWEQLKYAADAITYTTGGDYQLAVNWYKTALANYDNMDMRLSLGDAYQKVQGGGGEAMTSYEKIVEKDPKNSLAFSRIGKLWYDAKNYKLALENWEKAKEADPKNPLPYRDLADAYSYVGKYDLSKQNLEKYLEYSDKTDEDMERYMDILFLSKDYKGAVSKAEEFIGKGKTKPRYYGILAFSQYELGDSVNALKNADVYFQKQDPKKIYPNDYRQYGKIQLQNGRVEEADKYFNKAVDMDTSKNKSEAFRENAEALRAAKEWMMAYKWYDRLIRQYPDDAKALDYFYAGVSAYYGRDYNAAAKAYEAMETKFPDQPSATYWRGRTAAAIDNEAKDGTAVPFYTKWLELSIQGYERKPNDLMQAYQYLAVYYYNKNDKANTEKYLNLIQGLEPNNALIKQIRDAMSKKKS